MTARAADRLVLPAGVVLSPVVAMPAVRPLVPDAADDDWLLTRPGTREPTRLITGDLAGLLRRFEVPRTLVEAVVDFANEQGARPETVLDEAYPLVRELVAAGLLMPEGVPLAGPLDASLRRGRRIGGFEVGRLVQSLTDVEVYQGRTRTGEAVALKVSRGDDPTTADRLAHEARILTRLNGRPSPRLLRHGRGNLAYLALEWCPGVAVSQAAAELRMGGQWTRLHALGVRILDAYADVHARQIAHGDIHPRNILMEAGGAVRLLDFGLAFELDPPVTVTSTVRGGVNLFAEPEYVEAWLGHHPAPPPTVAGEQYALAVLLFGLFTGSDYLRLPLEREAGFRHIAHAAPLSFVACGSPARPALEAVLRRALEKAPGDRFASTARFARALERAAGRSTMARVKNVKSRASRLIRHATRRWAALRPNGASAHVPPSAGVYNGVAGAAYGLLRLAEVRSDAHLMAIADFHASQAWTAGAARGGLTAAYEPGFDHGRARRRTHPASAYHRLSGVCLVRALVAQAAGQPDVLDASCRRFLVEIERPGTAVNALDLTLGRAGALVACSLLHNRLRRAPAGSDTTLRTGVEAAGDALVQSLCRQAGATRAARGWMPGGLTGMAHGSAGLLYAILLWHSTRQTRPASTVASALDRLAALAEPDGRGVSWPVGLGRREAALRMASWCNGAPGQTLLWTLAYRMFGEAAHLALAERSAWNAWEAEPANGSLCCGEAGRAYATLACWRETGERGWLTRARALAERAARHVATDGPDSLFKGALGVAVALSDCDEPARAAFPLIECPA